MPGELLIVRVNTFNFLGVKADIKKTSKLGCVKLSVFVFNAYSAFSVCAIHCTVNIASVQR